MTEAYRIVQGDCRVALAETEENSVDAVVTDPPYGLVSIQKRFGKEDSAECQFGTDGAFHRASRGFMGQTWDGTAIEQDPAFWAKVHRVMKPGAHLLAFSGTRTSHRQACAIEDAGFEIRDTLAWIYGSGFPKSKNLDGEWEGWGTALKPSQEPITLARKPLSESSVSANVLRWGTGALNVDGCRVGHDEPCKPMKAQDGGNKVYRQSGRYEPTTDLKPSGRWPPNLLLSHLPTCRLLSAGQPITVTGAMTPNAHEGTARLQNSEAKAQFRYRGEPERWSCDPSCVVAELDRQSGDLGNSHRPNRTPGQSTKSGMFLPGQLSDTYEGSGGASRFFPQFSYSGDDLVPFRYVAKAAASERSKGCERLPRKTTDDGRKKSIDNPFLRGETARRNVHPTVKPCSLMQWLVRLVTPPGGLVLDPFMGSGSTGVGCMREGFRFIGMEQDPSYVEIARARIEEARLGGRQLDLLGSA